MYAGTAEGVGILALVAKTFPPAAEKRGRTLLQSPKISIIHGVRDVGCRRFTSSCSVQIKHTCNRREIEKRHSNPTPAPVLSIHLAPYLPAVTALLAERVLHRRHLLFCDDTFLAVPSRNAPGEHLHKCPEPHKIMVGSSHHFPGVPSHQEQGTTISKRRATRCNFLVLKSLGNVGRDVSFPSCLCTPKEERINRGRYGTWNSLEVQSVALTRPTTLLVPTFTPSSVEISN